jgi:phospholipase/lecithinase/hemolysin
MRFSWIIAGASLALAKPKKANFDTLVTFGDSWTDNGRLGYYINNGGKAPPPGQMHPESTETASGGLSWAQYAARDANAALRDYAVGGAVCSNSIVARHFAMINRTFPAIVDDQLPSFKTDIKFKSLYPHRTADNTVYAVWIGTNDLGFDAFLSDSQAPGKTISDFVSCVFGVLDEIYKTGGRRFVVLNAGPLELTPLYAHPDNGGTYDSMFWTTKTQYNITQYSQKIREFSTSVNTMYEYGLPVMVQLKKRWPKATVDLFDVHSLFLDIYQRPTKYLSKPYNVNSYYHQCEPAGSPCVDLPGSLDGYMWFDELHPSNKTSKLASIPKARRA